MKNLCVVLALLAFSGVALAQDATTPHTATPTGTVFSLPDGFVGDLVATFAFALVGIVALVLGFWVFDKMTPKCCFMTEIGKGNVSAGIVSASLVLGLAYLIGKIAAAIIGQ